MIFKLTFKKSALKEILKISENKALQKKLQNILADIQTNPYSTSFMFERLKHNFQGYCSKKLSKGDKIIYKVYDDEVKVLIVSVLGHYKDI
jgi:toxin YoeB